MTDRDLLDEQIAYYRARAAEYDATSVPEGDSFAAHIARIVDELRRFVARGRVIEIAAGTGQWTGILAETAAHLTVTDASPEMLALNRERTGDRPNLAYRVADAFALEPTRDYDNAFFGFFLSHVPPGRLEGFWAAVEGLLVPGGRCFFVDEASHGLWDEDWIDRAAGVVRRTRLDGTVHRVIKVLWQPSDLAHVLAGLGWDASVHAEGPFYWGSARPRVAAERDVSRGAWTP